MTLVAGSPPVAVALTMKQTHDNYLQVLVLTGLATAIAWLAALRLLRHPFWTEVQLIVDRLRTKRRQDTSA